MTDQDGARTRRVAGWILDGPSKEDGTPGYVIGALLWWRIWASTFLVGAPLACGFYALLEYGGFAAVLVTTAVAWIASQKATQISPKYDVTKNY